MGNTAAAIEYAYGCRSPGSQAFSPDAVFLVVKNAVSSFITVAEFVNGTDYIGHPKTDEDAKSWYDSYIDRGWVRMMDDDLARVAGLHNKDTTVLHWGLPTNLSRI